MQKIEIYKIKDIKENLKAGTLYQIKISKDFIDCITSDGRYHTFEKKADALKAFKAYKKVYPKAKVKNYLR